MIEAIRPTEMAAGDSDRTVLVPRPAGRTMPAGDGDGDGAPPTAAGRAAPRADSDAIRRQGHGLNPLVHAANPLLDLVVPLRYVLAHPNVDDLRQNLIRAVKDFEAEAKASHIDAQSIAIARYALCTFLDETIANTPAGSGGAWASKSLLVAFHNEAWGGEKFFLILQRLAQEPARHLHLLELMYVCLMLGFEGRYRVLDGGRTKLESLAEQLKKMIVRQRGALDPALSPHVAPSTARPESFLRDMPLLRTAIAVAALILSVHIGLDYTLAGVSDPVLAQLEQLRLAIPAPPVPARQSISLPDLLAPEIAHGLVSVSEDPQGVRITLRGDGVFASARADVANIHKPLIDRIGDAFRQIEGKVTVIGHTDNVPSASRQFPSNEELSLARAETVRALLVARSGNPARYSVEGFGDSEPLVPNNSAANRARNRRVDILLSAPDEARKRLMGAAAPEKQP